MVNRYLVSFPLVVGMLGFGVKNEACGDQVELKTGAKDALCLRTYVQSRTPKESPLTYFYKARKIILRIVSSTKNRASLDRDYRILL